MCNAPTHKDLLKCYTHAHDQCHVRKKCLEESGGENLNASIQANAGEDIDVEKNLGDVDAKSALVSENGSEPNLNALLATAMNLVTDNDAL